jgi:hypothetical protein
VKANSVANQAQSAVPRAWGIVQPPELFFDDSYVGIGVAWPEGVSLVEPKCTRTSTAYSA